jgi:hypothetical protein
MSIPHIPEQFLRQIWQQQRFIAHNLHTSNGKPVRIISPGTPNNAGGLRMPLTGKRRNTPATPTTTE